MLTKIILIFIAGFAIDLLTTKYTCYITQKKTGQATLLSGMITVLNFVLLTLILKEGASESLTSILAFAGGNSLGTFLALKKI